MGVRVEDLGFSERVLRGSHVRAFGVCMGFRAGSGSPDTMYARTPQA